MTLFTWMLAPRMIKWQKVHFSTFLLENEVERSIHIFFKTATTLLCLLSNTLPMSRPQKYEYNVNLIYILKSLSKTKLVWIVFSSPDFPVLVTQLTTVYRVLILRFDYVLCGLFEKPRFFIRNACLCKELFFSDSR